VKATATATVTPAGEAGNVKFEIDQTTPGFNRATVAGSKVVDAAAGKVEIYVAGSQAGGMTPVAAFPNGDTTLQATHNNKVVGATQVVVVVPVSYTRDADVTVECINTIGGLSGNIGTRAYKDTVIEFHDQVGNLLSDVYNGSLVVQEFLSNGNGLFSKAQGQKDIGEPDDELYSGYKLDRIGPITWTAPQNPPLNNGQQTQWKQFTLLQYGYNNVLAIKRDNGQIPEFSSVVVSLKCHGFTTTFSLNGNSYPAAKFFIDVEAKNWPDNGLISISILSP
jgi:hypothetical protein